MRVKKELLFSIGLKLTRSCMRGNKTLSISTTRRQIGGFQQERVISSVLAEKTKPERVGEKYRVLMELREGDRKKISKLAEKARNDDP